MDEDTIFLHSVKEISQPNLVGFIPDANNTSLAYILPNPLIIVWSNKSVFIGIFLL